MGDELASEDADSLPELYSEVSRTEDLAMAALRFFAAPRAAALARALDPDEALALAVGRVALAFAAVFFPAAALPLESVSPASALWADRVWRESAAAFDDAN